MKIGRELDTHIVGLLGWQLVSQCPDGEWRGTPPFGFPLLDKEPDSEFYLVPRFSSSLDVAWRFLADRLYADGWSLSLGTLGEKPRGYRCEMVHMGNGFHDEPRQIEVNAFSPAMAICKAFLFARDTSKDMVNSP
jgi:hypothetical protein